MQKEVAIPSGISVRQENNSLIVTGKLGEVRKEFVHPSIKIEVKGDKVIFSSVLEKKKINALLKTYTVLLNNMIIGVTKGYRSEVKVVFSHFPVKINVEGDRVLIQNFLGERKPRSAKILPGVEVKIEKDNIIVTGIDKENVGQTAANLEQVTKISGYDKRVFQDGCYIVSKPAEIEKPEGEE